MSDTEKPTPDDLAPASAHRQRWEDARTTEEALRRNLFAAREALNVATAKLAKVVALNEEWQGSEQVRRMPAGLLIDALRDALK